MVADSRSETRFVKGNATGLRVYSLSDYAVSAETFNTFKRRLDKFWSDQDNVV